MEEGIIELDDVLVAELVEDVDLNSEIGELLQKYGIKRTLISQLMANIRNLSLIQQRREDIRRKKILTSSDSSWQILAAASLPVSLCRAL